jgi:hypothetical protein
MTEHILVTLGEKQFEHTKCDEVLFLLDQESKTCSMILKISHMHMSWHRLR